MRCVYLKDKIYLFCIFSILLVQSPTADILVDNCSLECELQLVKFFYFILHERNGQLNLMTHILVQALNVLIQNNSQGIALKPNRDSMVHKMHKPLHACWFVLFFLFNLKKSVWYNKAAAAAQNCSTDRFKRKLSELGKSILLVWNLAS